MSSKYNWKYRTKDFELINGLRVDGNTYKQATIQELSGWESKELFGAVQKLSIQEMQNVDMAVIFKLLKNVFEVSEKVFSKLLTINGKTFTPRELSRMSLPDLEQTALYLYGATKNCDHILSDGFCQKCNVPKKVGREFCQFKIVPPKLGVKTTLEGFEFELPRPYPYINPNGETKELKTGLMLHPNGETRKISMDFPTNIVEADAHVYSKLFVNFYEAEEFNADVGFFESMPDENLEYLGGIVNDTLSQYDFAFNDRDVCETCGNLIEGDFGSDVNFFSLIFNLRVRAGNRSRN